MKREKRKLTGILLAVTMIITFAAGTPVEGWHVSADGAFGVMASPGYTAGASAYIASPTSIVAKETAPVSNDMISTATPKTEKSTPVPSGMDFVTPSSGTEKPAALVSASPEAVPVPTETAKPVVTTMPTPSVVPAATIAPTYLPPVFTPAPTVKATKKPAVKTAAPKLVPDITVAGSIKKPYGAGTFDLGVVTNSNGKISYKSSNIKVVTVSKLGKATVKGYGVSKITVKTAASANFVAASKTFKVTIIPNKISGFKVTSPSKGRILCKWTRDSTVKRCEIYIADNKKMDTPYKYRVRLSKRRFKIGTERETKYVRMRSYKIKGGKTYYSKWTSIKKIKVK